MTFVGSEEGKGQRKWRRILSKVKICTAESFPHFFSTYHLHIQTAHNEITKFDYCKTQLINSIINKKSYDCKNKGFKGKNWIFFRKV